MSKTLKDNLSFILICLLIFAAILAVAYILEKLLVKDRKKLGSTHFISYTAIFSAMAGFLMFLEIPLFFAPAFYEIDLSEIPILICTFYLGPVAGVVGELLKIVVKLVLKGHDHRLCRRLRKLCRRLLVRASRFDSLPHEQG